MNEEPKTPEQPVLAAVETKPRFNLKILIIGLPVFIVQLVLVYFISANLLFNNSHLAKEEGTSIENAEEKEHSKEASTGEVIFNVEDMIVNPAGTNGKMLILASFGLAVDKEESRKILEEKQIVVKDVIISVLSAKTIDQLSKPTYKDSLKLGIITGLASQVPNIKIANVYFSKFIIQ